MSSPIEGHRSGLEALATVTSLMQRNRNSDPVAGLYEAAEYHWWWSVPRSTDDFPQLFWFDSDGRPEAAATITDFGSVGSALYGEPILVVTTVPGADDTWVTHVLERGLAHAADHGITSVAIEVDQTDELQRRVLFDRGFEVADDGLVECWLDAAELPEISPLHDGYRLATRSDTDDRPHHMADDRRPDIEARLQQTSLYRADLDLVVYAGDDVAGFGLFWHDPGSATGVVEPMRTHDDHQQRGLARHILTAGLHRLAAAGAERISIGYEPGNPASGHLYRSVGFVPHQQTDLLAGPTSTP